MRDNLDALEELAACDRRRVRRDGRVRRPLATAACTTRLRCSATARCRSATTSASSRTSACSTSSGTSCRETRRAGPRGDVGWASRCARTRGTRGAPFDDYAATCRVIVNINGSPYHHGKVQERLEFCRDRARETGAWFVYVNAVGGQDELVFDGGSIVVAPDGTVAAAQRCSRRTWSSSTIDGDQLRGRRPGPWPDGPEEVYRALVLGVARLRAQERVPRGGPRAVGWDRFGVGGVARRRRARPEAVRVLAMPSRYSARERRGRRRAAPGAPGSGSTRSPITDDLRRVPTAARRRLRRRRMQASPRRTCRRASGANLLMALSNKFGSIVLATGNKSEYAVGYATLYGDMAGGFAPIKDVPKTLVYELAAWRNAQAVPARRRRSPSGSSTKAADRGAPAQPAGHGLASALRDARPDHRGLRRGRLGVDDIVPAGFDRATVERVRG